MAKKIFAPKENRKPNKKIFAPKENKKPNKKIFAPKEKAKSIPKAPKSKKQAFAEFKKREGYYHKADPLHPMNRESMGVGRKYGGMVKKKSGGSVGHCNRLY